ELVLALRAGAPGGGGQRLEEGERRELERRARRGERERLLPGQLLLVGRRAPPVAAPASALGRRDGHGRRPRRLGDDDRRGGRIPARLAKLRLERPRRPGRRPTPEKAPQAPDGAHGEPGVRELGDVEAGDGDER